jgi:nucleoside-diphosphate-sugar epimerase
MRYALTGGTGFLGTALAGRLYANGHALRALVRDPDRATVLAGLGAELVPGDLDDVAGLDRLAADVDGLFHVAGLYTLGLRDTRAFDRINVEGTRHVLEAARRNGVPRTVYTSTLAVNSDTEEQVVDESYHFDGVHLSHYDRSKAQAHTLAQEYAAAGLDVVVVQPGLIYGPGDTSQPGRLIREVALGRRPLAPRGGGVCWAHVDDVANGHLLAMSAGRRGSSYHLTGDRMSLADGLRLVATIAGTKGPLLVPAKLIRVSAALSGRVEKVLPMPSEFAAETMRASLATYYGNPAKAERELGWTHRPVEQGLRETVAALR